MTDFKALLKQAVDSGASDIHLHGGRVPVFRVNGSLARIGDNPVAASELQAQIAQMLPERLKGLFSPESAKGLDFSYAEHSCGRFRCSAYYALGQPGVTLRAISGKIRSVEKLKLPNAVRDVALSRRGLTLVAGTTGSGRSTTLAAMIDLINNTCDVKVVTVEDPIEYVYTDKRALISQFEVGTDTASLDEGLRRALRQDADVIVVGEIRDADTLKMALRAVDDGHQVLSTVHATRASQAIEQLVAMFPPAEQNVLLGQLAHSLEAILTQRLVDVRPESGGGQRAAIEILRGGPVTEKLILERKFAQLGQHIEFAEDDMQTFDQHLIDLYRERVISGTEALKHADRPEALAVAIRGLKHVPRALA
jgi:twitching motility protein PilT